MKTKNVMTKLTMGTSYTMKISDIARFKQHVKQVDECWEWQGRLDRYGYGEFKHGGVKHKAHRWIYQQLNFTLESDMFVDHLCRNRKCVRPAHLELVTPQENTRRGTANR